MRHSVMDCQIKEKGSVFLAMAAIGSPWEDDWGIGEFLSPNGQIRHHSSDRIVGNVGAANKKGLPKRKYGKSGVHLHWTTSYLLEELYVPHVRNINGNFL